MIHPIEVESFRILTSRVDLSGRTPGEAAVIGRIIHASADIEFAETVVVDEASVVAGIAAIRASAPVICDVQMVRSGITGSETICLLSEVEAGQDGTPTRSANAMTAAATRWPDGAIVVIGCAPTALFETVRLISSGAFRPALVIGLPVGFVGAAESKDALRQLQPIDAHSVPIITNRGEKGGSAVAAAAFNALVRLANEPTSDTHQSVLASEESST